MRWLSKSTYLSSRPWRSLPWAVSALLGAGLVLFGCSAQMTQNVGCNTDADCPNNLHCDPTGRCVAPPTYSTVTVAKLGDGDGTITSTPAGIDCGTTCSAMFADGEQLTLTATANPGSVVAGFSVGCNSNTTTCSFTPTDPTTTQQVLVNFAVGTALPAAALCNGSGYCWENPRPQGNHLNKVVVVGLNDEWAVGDAGTIVHRNSAGTTLAVSGVTRNLNGLWASGTDLYAVGQGGTILHNSGGAWTPEASGITTDLYDVAGNGTNIFAVGAGGVILRRGTGASWSADISHTTSNLRGLTSAAAGDMYAVGNAATVVHYSGGTWTAGTSPVLNGSILNGVAAAAGGSPLYIVSDFGEIFSLNAGTYTSLYKDVIELRGITVSPFGIIAVGVGNGGIILRSSNGTTWSLESISAQAALNGVAAGSGEVTVVGETGAMLRYDGSPWTPLSSGRISQLRSVHAVDAQNGWAVGLGGTILRWNGTYWAPVGLTGAVPTFYGVFTVSATDAWAVGSGGAIWRWNGTTWGSQTSGTTANLRAVWAAAANKVYVVGDGGVAQMWDGTTWNQVGAGNGVNLAAVWGSGPSDVWAAGDGGAVLHATGASFVAVAGGLGTTAAAGGVWAGAPSNVWFAADTNMYQFNGASFTKYATTATGLRAVSGAGTNLWAVGNAGALLHWNGTSWDTIDAGTKRDFYSIFLGLNKQWIAGDLGTLLSKPR